MVSCPREHIPHNTLETYFMVYLQYCNVMQQYIFRFCWYCREWHRDVYIFGIPLDRSPYFKVHLWLSNICNHFSPKWTVSSNSIDLVYLVNSIYIFRALCLWHVILFKLFLYVHKVMSQLLKNFYIYLLFTVRYDRHRIVFHCFYSIQCATCRLCAELVPVCMIWIFKIRWQQVHTK